MNNLFNGRRTHINCPVLRLEIRKVEVEASGKTICPGTVAIEPDAGRTVAFAHNVEGRKVRDGRVPRPAAHVERYIAIDDVVEPVKGRDFDRGNAKPVVARCERKSIRTYRRERRC